MSPLPLIPSRSDTVRRPGRESGITLLEVLVVLAIIGLLVVALLQFIFPSDDKICRLEAERLAAYMISAWAEAEVRDGPVRVSIDFNENSARREVTRASADIMSALWANQPGVEQYELESPAVFTHLNPANGPELTGGTGYVNFEGSDSEGAVVTLAVGDAIYSVVIASSGTVEVVEGKASVPGQQNYARPPIPDLLGYAAQQNASAEGPTNIQLADPPPMTRRPSTGSTANRRKATSAKDVKKVKPPKATTAKSVDDFTPGSDGYPAAPQLNNDYTPPSTPSLNTDTTPTDPPSDESEPPKNEDGPCQTHTDCVDDGPWRICQAGRCSVWPYGRTLMLANVQVQEPNQLANILDALLGDLIDRGELIVMLNLDQPNLWLVQGVRSGSFEGLAKYGQSEQFPTYRSQATYITGCEQGICTAQFRPDTEDETMSLYIRDSRVEDDSAECKYQPLELIDVTVLAAVNVQPQAGVVGNQLPSSSLTLSGTIRPSTARSFQVNDDENLLDILERFSVDPNADTVNDGVPDSWQFTFQGGARSVYFEDDPTSREDVRPENCEVDAE